MIPTNILSLEECLFAEEIKDRVPDYLGCTVISHDREQFCKIQLEIRINGWYYEV